MIVLDYSTEQNGVKIMASNFWAESAAGFIHLPASGAGMPSVQASSPSAQAKAAAAQVGGRNWNWRKILSCLIIGV